LQQLLQCRLLHKIAGITTSILGITLAVMKKSQRTDHEVIEFRMTRTLNEDSPNINTPGQPLKRGGQKRVRWILYF